MGVEIERQFLVRDDSWRANAAPGVRMRQGYLSTVPDRVVRVRISNGEAFLTIKGRPVGTSRAEFEYVIPVADAEDLLTRCEGSVIDKIRHMVVFSGRQWVVDIFRGGNEGLIMAEVELESEREVVALPPWAGAEVTSDHRYDNSNLALRPYSTW